MSNEKADPNIHVIDEEDKERSPEDHMKQLVTGPNDHENVDDTRGQTIGEEFSPLKIAIDQSKDVIDKELSVEQQSPV